jgi:hypothetical protein
VAHANSETRCGEIALWAVGIETKGRVLEQITAAEQTV